jgi:hypothetical protein
MVKCGVLFEVRTGFLNNIYTSFVFKGLIAVSVFTEKCPLKEENEQRSCTAEISILCQTP